MLTLPKKTSWDTGALQFKLHDAETSVSFSMGRGHSVKRSQNLVGVQVAKKIIILGDTSYLVQDEKHFLELPDPRSEEVLKAFKSTG